MEEIQENWQQRAQWCQPSGTPAQTEPTSSSTGPATPDSIDSRILAYSDQLNAMVQDLSPSLSLGPWSLLAGLVATSIPDPDNPVRPSHPSWSYIIPRGVNNDADQNDAYGDSVPNPRGQEDWVDELVSESGAALERLLGESRRVRELRLEHERPVRRQQTEVLLLGGGGDDKEEDKEEGSWSPAERALSLLEARRRLRALAEADGPWTCRCACLDQNGREREGEWVCFPPPLP